MENHNWFTTYESDYPSHLSMPYLSACSSTINQLWFSLVQLACCKTFAICCTTVALCNTTPTQLVEGDFYKATWLQTVRAQPCYLFLLAPSSKRLWLTAIERELVILHYKTWTRQRWVIELNWQGMTYATTRWCFFRHGLTKFTLQATKNMCLYTPKLVSSRSPAWEYPLSKFCSEQVKAP